VNGVSRPIENSNIVKLRRRWPDKFLQRNRSDSTGVIHVFREKIVETKKAALFAKVVQNITLSDYVQESTVSRLSSWNVPLPFDFAPFYKFEHSAPRAVARIVNFEQR
jgi:hypothetical protein